MLRCIRCRWRRNVKALHQPALFLAILLATDTTALTSCDRRVHATVLQDLDQLAPERRNVLLDLVHIILGNALRFRLSLLYRDIPAHQIAHDALVPEVAFARLLHLPLKRGAKGRKPKPEQIAANTGKMERPTYTRGRGSEFRERGRERERERA
uniref:Putative secreted protein n=1 Tax=Anopheles darlingi TaxID=43151 RepID=A0A2M4DBS3_ANODA